MRVSALPSPSTSPSRAGREPDEAGVRVTGGPAGVAAAADVTECGAADSGAVDRGAAEETDLSAAATREGRAAVDLSAPHAPSRREPSRNRTPGTRGGRVTASSDRGRCPRHVTTETPPPPRLLTSDCRQCPPPDRPETGALHGRHS
ncbi:hypothetical protein FRACA_130031 [Frankia canadensis]|uniref:Uncharacterized protein n=1 Tax=Frankia canadensis TaxID=1836972 RepID=A0A2I2KKN6_9ACTN|nr:hypothetical protein FRACA_130031 [Frankia canadensis]SOU53497.1 hypothetical protein FRACA_130031 [Frankia canadensis]